MNPRTQIVAGLVVVLVLLLGLDRLLALDPSQRNYEVFYEMANSRAYETWSDNPVYADGQTVHLPPEGAIARGALPILDPATATNPYSADDAAVLARGAAVFGNHCAVCHGPMGQGDGTVTQRGVPPPPNFVGGKVPQMTDAELFGIVTNGRNNMPPYASQVPREDRWKVLRYVRRLAEGKP